MRIPTLALALCLALPAFLGACKSDDDPNGATATLPCTCGDPATALDGCVHPLCATGQSNPDNPDCVCGPLAHEEN